jgi:hypothetical protein
MADESAAYIDLSGFPPVPAEARPRRVVVVKLSALDREALRARGYEPKVLLEFPRKTPADEIEYLLARLQGIEEGTLPGTKGDLEAIKLQMQAHGMLKSTGIQMRVKMDPGDEDVEALLRSWGDSRYTLRGNSTMVSAQIVPKKRDMKAGEGKRVKDSREKGLKKEITDERGKRRRR